MTTILACDVLPDMVIRTMFEPDYRAGLVASATFRVASVDRWDGTIRIHADSRSSQIYEIPDHVQVQVLQWPTYAHEVVVTDPEVMESCREDPENEADSEAPRKAMAEGDSTRLTFHAELPGRQGEVAQERESIDPLRKAMAEDNGTRVPMVEVNGYIRDVADGGIPIDDQVKAAVEHVLRRQRSEAAKLFLGRA